MKTLFIYLAMINANYNIDLDRKQSMCLATAVYHEARGEPILGQASVAHVVIQRVASKRYPNTICKVIYQPHQFTDIRTAKPNYKSKAWAIASEVAAFTQVGLIDNVTKEATLYYNPKKVFPKWDFSKIKLVKILNNHNFYKEI